MIHASCTSIKNTNLLRVSIQRQGKVRVSFSTPTDRMKKRLCDICSSKVALACVSTIEILSVLLLCVCDHGVAIFFILLLYESTISFFKSMNLFFKTLRFLFELVEFLLHLLEEQMQSFELLTTKTIYDILNLI